MKPHISKIEKIRHDEYKIVYLNGFYDISNELEAKRLSKEYFIEINFA